MQIDLTHIREALEASWDEKTSYCAVSEQGNPALGQCYPTSRIVQMFFADAEVVEGEVWTGVGTEKHFWNLVRTNDQEFHIDLTWQQFPHSTVVKNWKIRDRETFGDSQKTIDRVDLLNERVRQYLSSRQQADQS